MNNAHAQVGDWICFYHNGILSFDRVEYIDRSIGGRTLLYTVSHAVVDAVSVMEARSTKDDDAHLDDEEDRFVRKLWVDTTPPPWYEQGKVLTEINALIAKDVPPEDEEPPLTNAEYNAQIQRALRGEE